MNGTKRTDAKQAQTYERLYKSLYRIRRVEEEIARIYPTDKIKSPIHLSIGQEAIAVGVCEALRRDDIVFGTYRSHAVYLAKGGNLDMMLAELYGKSSGCGKGKGGSMHLIALESGVMGTSAIVGTSIPQAVGYAYALKIRKSDSIVVSFFGDGAVDEGTFHESLNFAALKKLPIIFICENNLYAIHSHYLTRHSFQSTADFVRGYGITTETIPDNDILKIFERVSDAANQIRSTRSGPWFFECFAYRWKEHVGPADDWNLNYRTKEEARPWIENDQVKRLKALLVSDISGKIESSVEAEIAAAFKFAEESPVPQKADLYQDIFKEVL